MKIILFALLSLLAATHGLAQSDNTFSVPFEARTDLSRRFENAHEFKWFPEDDGYEASGLENGKKVFVVYSQDGKWKETEREITIESLPATFLIGFKNSFPTGEIVDVETLERPDRPLAYEVKFYLGQEFNELVFGISGAPEEAQGGK